MKIADRFNVDDFDQDVLNHVAKFSRGEIQESGREIKLDLKTVYVSVDTGRASSS